MSNDRAAKPIPTKTMPSGREVPIKTQHPYHPKQNLKPNGPGERKAGRQKGTKNKITLLKLAVEESVRDRNRERMIEVCNTIIDQALDGDRASQKLVWQSVVSNGVSDEVAAKEKVTISINAAAPPTEKVVIDQEKEEDESQADQ